MDDILDNINNINHIKNIINESIKPNPRQLNILSGPCLFTYYPNFINRKLLFVDEIHNKRHMFTQLTPSIYETHRWLYDLCMDAPECVDLFLEIPYIHKINPNYDYKFIEKIPMETYNKPLVKFEAPLDAVRQIFSSCYTEKINEKKLCFSNMVRLHYVDIRMTNPIGSPIFEFQNFETNNPNITKLTQLPTPTIDTITKIFNYIIYERNSSDGIIFFTYICDLYSQYDYKLTSYKEKYYQYMSEYLRIRRKRIEKLDPIFNYSSFWESYFNVWIHYITNRMDNSLNPNHSNNIYSINFNIGQLLIDLYIITRIFTKFDASKMSRGPTGCKNNPVTKNVIVYAGKDHCEFLAKALSKYKPNIMPLINSDICWQKGKKSHLIFDKPFDYFA